MVKDPPVAFRNGVVRFVNDNDREVVRIESRQSSALAVSQRLHRCDHDLCVARGTFFSPLDSYFQIRIDRPEFLLRLRQQFLAVRENQQTLFHPERGRKVRKHHGLSGAGRQGDQHPPLPSLVRVLHPGKGFSLIITELQHGLCES